MLKQIILLSTILSSLLTGCNMFSRKNEDKPIAKVNETLLLSSEVSSIVPKGTSASDSIILTESYIRSWVTKQLLLQKAIENLSEEERNIQKQVEDYGTSLLIHRYKQKLIDQKLLADVSDEEIKEYYEKKKDNFILATPIVQAIICIVPKTAPHLDDIRLWYKSSKSQDLDKLEEYCISNARKYDNFNKQWIELKYVISMFPYEDGNKVEKEALTKNYVEREDEDNIYLLRINEIQKEQTIAPLNYVRNEIILILKNKKKLNFEGELDMQINEEAARKRTVTLY